MFTRLSTKGQLVIPKEIRQALNLKPGAKFRIEVIEGQIVLSPMFAKDEVRQIVNEMRRLVGDEGVLEDLESEHPKEMERDRAREHSLSSG